jgi:hypothetical protein
VQNSPAPGYLDRVAGCLVQFAGYLDRVAGCLDRVAGYLDRVAGCLVQNLLAAFENVQLVNKSRHLYSFKISQDNK